MRMKSLVTGMLVAGLLVLTAGLIEASITGSPHDFSAAAWNGTGEICAPCHTPHNGNTSVVDAPLWNHDVTAVTAYGLYNSSTMNATTGQPDGRSRLCLSCHDGTVALDAFGGNTVSPGTTIGDVNADALLDTDLSNDHPTGFVYDTTLANNDGALHNPATQPSGLGGTINDDMLFAGRLECASCHDVHDQAGLGAAGHLLVKANTASALCLTCHDK